MKEEPLLIEFPDIPPEPEELPEESQEQRQENLQQNLARENLGNLASNRLAKENIATSTKEFFNEDYIREVEAARQMVNNVNDQLSKKVVSLEDIKMPVETTEGMNPDSIKRRNYTGESNIVYYLENRYHLRLPIPVYLSHSGGKIIVDIIVNRSGEVIKAEPRNSNGIRDEQIYLYAKAAALRTVFNSDPDAPAQQKGSIHYNFIPQR